MGRYVSVLLLVLAVFAANAQSRIGEKAPELKLGTILQGEGYLPKPGHAVVIEFWATWCVPCLESIPHLNELASRFRDKDVDFLWLSGESVEKIRPFLKAHPMRGTVAQDVDFVLYGAFGGRGLPTTVLLDRSGRVTAITRAEFVNADVLTALVDQKALPLQPLEADNRLVDHHFLFAQGSPSAKPNDADADVRMVVRRVNGVHGTFGSANTGQFETSGSSLKDLLAAAYEVSPFLIEMPEFLNQPYAVQGWAPDRYPTTLGPLMQAALCAGASIRTRHERRLMPVSILSGLPAGLARVPDSNLEEGSSMPGEIEWKTATAEKIRSSIEFAAQRVVILDRSVSGKFSFRLHWDATKADGLKTALRQRGLELTETRRSMDVLVVESLDGYSATK